MYERIELQKDWARKKQQWPQKKPNLYQASWKHEEQSAYCQLS